jgi:cytochrome c oxidase assembly protein subunit 16
MPVFPVKYRVRQNPTQEKVYKAIRKRPFLFFGLPFISIIVGASFFMTRFTQTRYDYQKTRTQIVCFLALFLIYRYLFLFIGYSRAKLKN